MSKEIVLLKKSEATQTEVVMPSDDMIARIVNARISEILTDVQTAELSPFFERREVAQAMLRSQDKLERHKWRWYFEEFGCLLCERKDVPIAPLGMCQRCFSRTRQRLSIVKRNHAPDIARQEFKDTLRLAREAVLPSIGTLAQKRGGK